jgi:hypothetical protein
MTMWAMRSTLLFRLCLFLGTNLYTENNSLKKKAVALYTCYLPAFTYIFSLIVHPVFINPFMPELNPSTQRCRPRFFTGDFNF